MVNTACLNGRLVQGLARSSTYSASHPIPYRTPLIWVRTITNTPSRPSRSTLTVSFGAENDALLAPHLQRLQEKEEKAESKKIKKFGARNTVESRESDAVNRKNSQASAANDFEIDDYVDLSAANKPRALRTPIDQTPASNTEMVDDTADIMGQSPLKKQNPKTQRESRSRDKSPPRTDSFTNRRDREDKVTRSARGKSERDWIPKDREVWQIQKQALTEKFGEGGWNPRKKLSPDAIEGIRGLHEQDSTKYSTSVLATQFEVSPEAIRRILKSRWSQTISPHKMQERRERWAKRHDKIWDRQAELGLRPQRVKDRDIEDPDQFEKDMVRKQTLGEI